MKISKQIWNHLVVGFNLNRKAIGLSEYTNEQWQEIFNTYKNPAHLKLRIKLEEGDPMLTRLKEGAGGN